MWNRWSDLKMGREAGTEFLGFPSCSLIGRNCTFLSSGSSNLRHKESPHRGREILPVPSWATFPESLSCKKWDKLKPKILGKERWRRQKFFTLLKESYPLGLFIRSWVLGKGLEKVLINGSVGIQSRWQEASLRAGEQLNGVLSS